MADINPQDRRGRAVKPHPVVLKGMMDSRKLVETPAQRRDRLRETMRRAVKKGGSR